MERTQVLELMSTLKLYGMRSAYDEVCLRERSTAKLVSAFYAIARGLAQSR